MTATVTTADRDAALMTRALELAERYRGRTAPNPIVGCVIASARGEILAEGAHRGPGTRHAEIDALAKLGGTARGATMYVTLEPCTHQGRTPPCAPAVIASGVARVVVGSVDPSPGHGGGIAALRKAGIEVARCLVDACDRANRAFLIWATQLRPAFTLKAAVTLDGKIATVTGHSRWITGEAARADVHRLRDTHDAVLVGIGTVLADNPRLTARLPRARDPIRIVLDARLRTPVGAHLLPGKRGPRTIIACSEHAVIAKERALRSAGAQIWRFEGRHVPLAKLARLLGDEDITSVLVEGGGEVHAGFLDAKLADQLVLYLAPKVVGGPAPSWAGGRGVATLAKAWGFTFEGPPLVLGDDLRLTAVRPLKNRGRPT